MEQIYLNTWQKKVITLVANEPNLTNFYLTGGSALAAYYLYHRSSEDLDFFTFKEPDPMFLHAFINRLKKKLEVKTIRFERLYDRNIFFFRVGEEEVKLEFTLYPFSQLEMPKIIGGIRVDSLRDIAANKLMAILDRFDPKDFVDLFFILKRYKLEKIRKDVEKKFGIKIDNIFLGGELMKVKRIVALPKMRKLLTIEKLKVRFASEAKKLSPAIFKA